MAIVTQLSESEMLMLLRDFVAYWGSQQEAARELGISNSYLNDILHGRRPAGDKVAQRFGYRYVRVYELA